MAVLQTLHCLPVTGVELLIRVIEEMHRVDQSRVDMSKLQLTRDQVIHILHSTQLAAKVLDLSHNTVLVASDIPAIVAAAGPTLRRLVLMDCLAIEGPSLLSLIGERPQELKCLEGILHPALLTLEKPDPYPSSFTFVNVKSTGTWVCTSIALFTPAQVVQALTDVVPWRNPSETQDGTIELPDSFWGAMPMEGCSAFHSGQREPGVGFGQRTVVSVPFQTPKIPREKKVLWTFFLQARDSSLRTDPGWAFVRFIPRDSSTPPSSKDRCPTLDEAYSEYEVCDLQGFLQCMEQEGRPMPTDAAVEKLEELLYVRDEASGKAYFPFLDDPTPVEPRRLSSWTVRYTNGFTF